MVQSQYESDTEVQPEDYYPYQKYEKYTTLAKKFEQEADLDRLEQVKKEFYLLNTGLGRKGDERNLWGWCMCNHNKPFRAWRREDVPYYTQRLNESKDPVELARYAYVLWCFERNIRYAEQTTNYLLEGANLYVQKDWHKEHYETTGFCFEFAARLSLSLSLKSPFDIVTILSCVRDAIDKSVSAAVNGRGTSDLIEVLAILSSDFRKHKYLRDSPTVKEIYRRTLHDCTTLANIWHNTGERHWQRSYLEYGARVAALTESNETPKFKLAIAESFVQEADSHATNSKIAESIFLEYAVQIYSELGLSEKVDALTTRIRECNQEAENRGEFHEISVPMDIRVDEVAERIEHQLMNKSASEVLQQIAFDRSLIPNMKVVQDTVKKIRVETPLTFLIPMTVNQRDLPSRTLMQESEIFEHKICEEFNVQAQLLETIFATLMNRMCKSKIAFKDFGDFLKPSKNITDNSQEMIRMGLERHLAYDYVSSVHILTPQIEEILRKILADRKVTTAKVGVGNDLLQEKLLTGLLAEAKGKAVLDAALIDYLEIRLTPRFANIRNKVCHGWMEAKECNDSLSWTLTGMILRLSVVT